MIKLRLYQEEALDSMYDGCVLNGGVGSGKTITSLAYYLKCHRSKKLHIITTAMKRDTHDWEDEGAVIGIHDMIVDSWQSIKKYKDVKNAFFIFDEQKVLGNGTWVQSFLTITKNNAWVLLSGTPGDNWIAYIPLFIANGWYRNRTDFLEQHVEYDRFSKFPKIKKYHNINKLEFYKNKLLVNMVIKRNTIRNEEIVYCHYDKTDYDIVLKKRWNIFSEKPIKTNAEVVQCLRKVCGVDADRIFTTLDYILNNPRLIIFYNYNYELEILKSLCEENTIPYYERNGYKHDPVPTGPEWVYLVQYNSGCEGWNCITTDTILFYSQNYAYWVMEQAMGRIDRMNTKFIDLRYITLSTKSPIDTAIRTAILKKKKFNENVYIKHSI